MQHGVIVKNREIRIAGNPRIVRNNVNVDTLTAEFDSAWEGLDGISVFFVNGDKVIRQAYSKNMVIPWEVLTDAGNLLLTFKGYRGDEVIIVTKRMKAGFVVEPCGRCEDGEEPSESSPTEIQQIYETVSEYYRDWEETKPRIETAIEDAEEATNKANNAADSVDESKRKAVEAADKANEAADKADEAADKANGVADEVQTKLDNGDFIGEKGDKGDKGDRGDDLIAMEVEDGYLVLYYKDNAPEPRFEIEGVNLVYVFD